MTFDKLKSQKEDQNPLAGDALSPSKSDALNLSKWEEKKLGEVCEIVNGSTPLRTNKDFWENGSFPWFTIDDIRTQGRVITTTKQKVTEAALSKLKVLPVDTVLLCCTASVGEYAITKIELTTNQQFNGLVVKDKDQLHPEFLMYYCSTLKDRLLELSGKTTIDFIAISKIKNLNIPLPPLSEQKKIVEVLDQAFAGIEQSRQNTKQNLKNAKEIFESYLQLALTPPQGDALSLSKSDVFGGSASSPTNKGDALSSSKSDALSPSKCDALSLSKWEEKTLGEVCEIRSGRNQKEVEDPKGIYPILGSAGKIMGYANKFICEEGTTIIGRKGTIDKPIFIEEKFWNVDTAFGLHALKELDKRFLFYFCKSYDFTKQDKGSGRPSLVKSDLLKINIPVPSLAKQQSIVHQLDALKAETQKLEAIYTQKLNDLEELKKSLLQKAFAGELVK